MQKPEMDQSIVDMGVPGFVGTLIGDVGEIKSMLEDLQSPPRGTPPNTFDRNWGLMEVGDKLEYVLWGVRELLK